jgi:predicted dehydrogenase
MSDRAWRVGIIGTGRVGIDWHLPSIREAGGEVTALADVVPGRAARFAAQHGVHAGYDRYQDLLASPDVDVVAICSPPSAHEELACAAFAAGRHVYLEKPPAMNAAEMQRIVDAGHRARRLLFSGSNNVYRDDAQCFKRWLDDGSIGDVYAVEALRLFSRNVPHGWHRRKAVAGGGVLMDSTAHRIDLALYLLGSPAPRSVTARVLTRFGGRSEAGTNAYLLMDLAEGIDHDVAEYDVDDTVFALVQFANGVVFTARDIKIAHMKEDQSFKLLGTRGGAELYPPRLYGDSPAGLLQETAPQPGPGPRHRHTQAYRHLFECLDQGRESTDSPGERSVLVMKIIDAIYASEAAGGRQVVL